MRPRFILSLLLLTGFLAAQPWESRVHPRVTVGDTTQLHQLILLDYTKFLGVVTYANGDSIRIQLRSVPEAISVPTSQLRFLGVFNPNAVSRSRNDQESLPLGDLTYERTALPYQRRARIRVIELLYFATEWTLGEHLELGVGVAGPLGLLFTQRYRTSLTPYLHLGLSNQLLYVPLADVFNDDGVTFIGDATTLLTVGDERRFLNLGAGLFYNTNRGEENLNNYRIGIGGRIHRRWHLYGEGLVVLNRGDQFRDLTFLPSLNAAYAIKRHRWTFGVFSAILDEDTFVQPPLPYVSYTYYF